MAEQASTLETLNFPKIPRQVDAKTIEELNDALRNHSKWQLQVERYNDELYQILHDGNLVRNFNVENLGADKLIAGIIAVDKIYLTSDRFEFDGLLEQIRVKDDQGSPVTRIEIGAFGSGSDYGIKIRDASGTVVFQATSTTFIDGAIITNATITDSKIFDVDGDKVQTGTLPNTALESVSADKITLSGTLTCTSTKTAIEITDAGVFSLSSGGDIIGKASPSGDSNIFKFQTSAGTDKLLFGYSVGTDAAFIYTRNGADLDLQAVGGSNIKLDAITGNIQLNSPIASNYDPATDNTFRIGTASLRCSDVRSVLINGADFCYENGIRTTEPNHVLEYADPDDGIMFMNQDWEIMGWWHRNGDMEIRGDVITNAVFPESTVPRREVPPRKENTRGLKNYGKISEINN